MGKKKSIVSDRFVNDSSVNEFRKTQELEKLKRLPRGFYKSGAEDHR